MKNLIQRSNNNNFGENFARFLSFSFLQELFNLPIHIDVYCGIVAHQWLPIFIGTMRFLLAESKRINLDSLKIYGNYHE